MKRKKSRKHLPVSVLHNSGGGLNLLQEIITTIASLKPQFFKTGLTNFFAVYPRKEINFFSTLERLLSLMVGISSCVLRSGANVYRCLVKRSVIPGPVACLFSEFLEYFDASVAPTWSLSAQFGVSLFWRNLHHCINYMNSPLTDRY